MSKQSLLLACSVLLLAGVAQAAAPETQAGPERPALDQREAPTPTAGDETLDAAGNLMAKEGGAALPTDARPVQANGGDCGGN